MEYNEFKESVMKELKVKLEGEADVSLKEVTKNNGVVLDGLVIARSDSKIAPTFYINDLYDVYQNGREFDEVLDFLMDSYEEHAFEFSFNPADFEDFSNMKDKLMLKVVNSKLNEKLLGNIPHRDFLDLSICYYVLIKDAKFESGSILINNDHADMWGVDEETLFEIAKENTRKNLGKDFLSMYEMMCELMAKRGEDEEFIKEALKPIDDKMFVLTNNTRQFGATCILYNDVLKEIADEKESNLIILPSSVHELIVLFSDTESSIGELNEMVLQVNENHVLPQEILSDHVYVYDREIDEIKMC